MTKRKLLLADDSITIQKVVNLTFADEGIEVIAFGNGSLAIEKLDEVHPDLVLADVHMPGLNGYEVCERVKQSAKFGKIPVMLLVGSFEPFDETEATRVGADDYLTKPFQSIKQLINKVNALLEPSPENNVETAQLNPVQEEQFHFGSAEVVEEKADNAPIANALDESPSFGDGLRNKFVDSGMDDKMIETNSFNWFTPKTSEAAENVEVIEKTENTEKQDLSFQQTYENPPIELNQTTPLSFSDVQEIAANSNSTPAQIEWSVAEKDDGNLLDLNENDVLESSEQPENKINIESANERGFDFELNAPVKDSWSFDSVSDSSWKISPPKVETQQNSNDFHSPLNEKIENVEPSAIDFDTTLEIADEAKTPEHKFEEAKTPEHKFENTQQNFDDSETKSTDIRAKNDDWYKPQVEQIQPVTENAILEIDDFKQFIFEPKDDDSILDLIQESHEIKTDVATNEDIFAVVSDGEPDDKTTFVDVQTVESKEFASFATTFEPIQFESLTKSTEKLHSFDAFRDAPNSNEMLQNIEVEAQKESAPEINDTQTQPNQALTPSNFEYMSPVSPNQGIEKTNERQIAQTREDSFANFYFTPEIIDAIAQKVVEKISDKVIEKIAWEIVPDRFDLIVKKQIEEHNRNS